LKTSVGGKKKKDGIVNFQNLKNFPEIQSTGG
jgi:hypothetical protein